MDNDLHERVENVEKLCLQTLKAVQALSVRIDSIEARLDSIEVRFDKFEARLDQFEARFDKLQVRVTRIESLLLDISHHFGVTGQRQAL